MFIDSHCHLFADEFNLDRLECLHAAKAAGVENVLLPNIDFHSIKQLLDCQSLDPSYFKIMIGLHPCSVTKDYKKDLDSLFKIISEHPETIGIGEIGLDYYWDKSLIEEQKDAFQIQISWAKELNLPIVIHTRDSFDDAFKLVKINCSDSNLRGVFHCFGGSKEEAQLILDLDTFYLGIGGVYTFKKSIDLRNFVREIGLNRVILETDSPYLAPMPFRGKRNEPKYLIEIAQMISDNTSYSLNEIGLITSKNCKELFLL
jgi:TatD DNase family protein